MKRTSFFLLLLSSSISIGCAFADDANSIIRTKTVDNIKNLKYSSDGKFYIINMCNDTLSSASLKNDKDGLKSVYNLPSALRYKPWNTQSNSLVGSFGEYGEKGNLKLWYEKSGGGVFVYQGLRQHSNGFHKHLTFNGLVGDADNSSVEFIGEMAIEHADWMSKISWDDSAVRPNLKPSVISVACGKYRTNVLPIVKQIVPNSDERKKAVEVGQQRGIQAVPWVKLNANLAVAMYSYFLGNIGFLSSVGTYNQNAGLIDNQGMYLSSTTDDWLWPKYAEIQYAILNNLLSPIKTTSYIKGPDWRRYEGRLKSEQAKGEPSYIGVKWSVYDDKSYYINSITTGLALFINAYDALKDNSKLDRAEKLWNWFEYSGVKDSNGYINDGYRQYATGEKHITHNDHPYYYGLYILGTQFLYQKTSNPKYLEAMKHEVEFVITNFNNYSVYKENNDSGIFFGILNLNLAEYLRFGGSGDDKLDNKVKKYLLNQSDRSRSKLNSQGALDKSELSLGAQATVLYNVTAGEFVNILK